MPTSGGMFVVVVVSWPMSVSGVPDGKRFYVCPHFAREETKTMYGKP